MHTQAEKETTDTSSDASDEIVLEKRLSAPSTFHFTTKDPQYKHIEENMKETTMEKHVANKLPDSQIV